MPKADHRVVLDPATPPELLDEYLRLKAQVEEKRRKEAATTARRYWNDPVTWARECLTWPSDGEDFAPYQAEALTMLAEKRRVAVRGPHGLGKTMAAAIAILWFAITRDAAGVDWKVPTTASVDRQLREYLWPEVRKWARLIRWDVVGREPLVRGRDLLELHIKLHYGEAFAVVSSDPQAIEGAHATELLYVFDEAKAISDGTFDAAEGAFSTAGADSGTNAYALAISTPGEPLGRFYDIHARRPGTEHWWTRHVSVDEAIAAQRVTREWVDQQRLLWGSGSAVFANRVLGEFAGSDEDAVIPLSWVEVANERWRALFTPEGERPKGRDVDQLHGTRSVVERGMKLHTVGVDVARGGSDRTVLALRQGQTVCELRRYPYSDDTMEITGWVVAVQEGHGDPTAIIDVIGVGAGVFDRTREQRRPCMAFNASEGTKRHDQTGEFGFTNMRSWGWWNLREMLDPNLGMEVALPPDDRLTGDLVAPKWRVMSGGRIQVEQKDDIRKRIGRSTDDGDAVVQAMAYSGGSWADLYRDAPEVDPNVPQPRQKPARSGGWGDVYMSEEQRRRRALEEGSEPEPVGPAATASNGYFAGAARAEPKRENRGFTAPGPPRFCACGDLEADHDDSGPCTGCSCPEFRPR